ncbi:ABC1 family protein [Aeromicrobium marinum DSM 15272]|uniref:ABC1 family protein n=1 Tax=Aeromicrobium marinum DSM 15272 TaxID=585531 RepID=E2SEB0_9ACTN|nr:AarF/ABC1/UbiB kinase family protein [Aeromicrobium marinum]EFQ82837.1 ABC1 family protein [Aeromicrobium marinum DSM 15272]
MPDDERRDPRISGNAFTRTAKLAALPAAFAGRTTLGVGKRMVGRPAEAVLSEVQRRTADQIFSTLGQLKGGAMKFGQAMSVFEAALPEEIIGPYREAFTRLQDAAPPMPPSVVHRMLAAELGEDWRQRFTSFEDTPAASASIGQVHRAVWADGREVAVKIQYPGAAKALQSDLRQIGRLSRMFGVLVPGLDVKPLIKELQDRVAEELDYSLEATSQAAFAEAYAGDPDVAVPPVVTHTERVLVTEWMESVSSLAEIISTGTQAERDHFGEKFARFLISAPQRVGLLHADPHPGNFRILADGRLGVVDYGAVARLPDGFPPAIGHLLSVAVTGDAEAVTEGLREEGFIKPGVQIAPEVLAAYIGPFFEPATVEQFSFSRAWLREQMSRVMSPGTEGFGTAVKVNLPPNYLLIHRVWLGAIGVLSQLEATAPFRAILLESLPGFADQGQH